MKTILPLFLIALTFCGCLKDKKENTSKQKLIDKHWQIKEKYVNGEDKHWQVANDDFNLDDYTVWSANGTYIYYDAGYRNPDLMGRNRDEGTWTFNDGSITLTSTMHTPQLPIVYSIDEITDNQMKLHFTINNELTNLNYELVQ